MKERIAEALYNQYIGTIYGLYPSWDVLEGVKKVPYYKKADAVIRVLKADVPKGWKDKLRKYLLYVRTEGRIYDKAEILAVADTDEVLDILAPYIEAKVKAEVDSTAKAFIKLMNDRIAAEVQTERDRIHGLIVEARKQITEEKERQRSLEPNDRQGEMAFNSQLKGLQQAIDIVKQEVC